MFLFRDFNISEKKEIRASIKQIYGISWYKTNKILNLLGFSNMFSCSNLNDYYVYLLLFMLKGFVLTDTKIKRLIDNNINNLLINTSYRGARHLMSLPVRGQRTRTNSATQRRKRVISKINE